MMIEVRLAYSSIQRRQMPPAPPSPSSIMYACNARSWNLPAEADLCRVKLPALEMLCCCWLLKADLCWIGWIASIQALDGLHACAGWEIMSPRLACPS